MRKHGPNRQQAEELAEIFKDAAAGLPYRHAHPIEDYLENHLDVAYGRGVRHERARQDQASEEGNHE